jgi:DNA-binding response OmpR family regulator
LFVQRVLLLEDHPRLAQLIQRALRQAGIECDVFEDAKAGRAALEAQAYGAALVDRGLPDGDGLALVRRWREAGEHLPCIMITARDALHDRVAGLEAGADDYLSKPFSMEELVARVRALLRRPPQQSSMAPRYGDVEIRPERALLICGEQSVVLPHTELQIMISLFKAQGAPVRRSALESAAWGLQEAVTPNALDVALHRLRKKLQAMGSTVRIHNQRAIGYAVGT